MKKLFIILVAVFFAFLTACEGFLNSSNSVVTSSSITSSQVATTSDEVKETVSVYFYNSTEWAQVSAYVYADDDGVNVEPLGAWPGTLCLNIGEGWYKAVVEIDVDSLKFNIIFNNNNNGQQAPNAFIQDKVNVYVNMKGNSFNTKTKAVDDLTVNEGTKIYFYNSANWTSLTAYGWGDGLNDPLGGWPGTPLINDGDDWWYVLYPYSTAQRPVNIIITGETDNPRSEVYVNDTTNVYLTINSNVKFNSKAAAEASLLPPVVSTKVHFYNSAEWANVYAYVYGDAGELLGGWSGRACSNDGDGWWSIDVPINVEETAFSIIFNNATSQSSDHYISNATNVFTTLTATFSSKAAAEASFVVSETTKVYFYNSDNWATVSAYIWGTDLPASLGGWPGTLCTSEGNGWFVVEVPLKAETNNFNIIFNNNDNGKQTDSVYIINATNVYVTVGNLAYGSKAAAEASLNPTVPTTTKVYFYNSDNWATVSAYIWGTNLPVDLGAWPGTPCVNEGEGWWSIEVPLVASDVNFNIIFNNHNNGKQTGGVLMNEMTKVYTTVGNQGFTTKEAAVASLNVVVTTKVYFYNSANWVSVKAYIWGTGLPSNLGGWPGTDCVNEGDGWWSIELPYSAQNHNFNIIFNNNAGAQTNGVYITNLSDVYTTINNAKFASKEAAIASIS